MESIIYLRDTLHIFRQNVNFTKISSTFFFLEKLIEKMIKINKNIIDTHKQTNHIYITWLIVTLLK